jgi:hypothetical protein
VVFTTRFERFYSFYPIGIYSGFAILRIVSAKLRWTLVCFGPVWVLLGPSSSDSVSKVSNRCTKS